MNPTEQMTEAVRRGLGSRIRDDARYQEPAVAPSPTVRSPVTRAQPPAPKWRERVVLDTLRLVTRHKVVCLLVFMLSTGAGGFATLFVPPFYIAKASLYPPQVDGPLGGLGIAGVAGLMGGLGIGGDASSKFPLYEHFLFSRRLVGTLLETPLDVAGQQVKLIDYLEIDEPDPALKKEHAIEVIRTKLSFEADKKTAVVNIGYTDVDPRMAAAVVNAAVDLLNHFDVSTTSRKAAERRGFVEVQMAEAAAKLSTAEQRIENFRAQNLRISNSPGLMMEQARLRREVEIEQEIYLTLRKEYELARIEEQRSVPVINILDRADPPVLPAGPSLIRNAVLAGVLGVGLVIMLFTLHAVQPRRLLAQFLAR